MNRLGDVCLKSMYVSFFFENSDVQRQKMILINTSQNDGFIDLGLTLQHEANRDGTNKKNNWLDENWWKK